MDVPTGKTLRDLWPLRHSFTIGASTVISPTVLPGATCRSLEDIWADAGMHLWKSVAAYQTVPVVRSQLTLFDDHSE